jgi:hypothetical protein
LALILVPSRSNAVEVDEPSEAEKKTQRTTTSAKLSMRHAIVDLIMRRTSAPRIHSR